MAAIKTYLVPVDFSKTAEKALAHAVRLARENKAKLLLFHGIEEANAMVPFQLRDHYFRSLEKEAKNYIAKLLRRHRLPSGACRVVVRRGRDVARLISQQAKQSRVAMIIMGSHGYTGLSRVLLGSVAEETLRYAGCPVLIVKK